MLKKINIYPIVALVLLLQLVFISPLQADDEMAEIIDRLNEESENVQDPCVSQKTIWAGDEEPVTYLKPKEHKNIFIYNDQTVTDTINKLEWKICPEGQQLLKNRCIGNVTLVSWHESFSLLEGKSYALKSDWRLPTIDELETIIDYCSLGGDYFNDEAFPPSDPGIYWTSSDDPGFFSDDVSWVVDFGSAVSSFIQKGRPGRLRAVRTMQ